ncbi:50S ribosomal protein L30 [Candidatus Kinetoplastibacterium sorsogonicusi]|uniref:Large ribosomal subunit protein uL30 n=1 Tax=Candidatus Kinetoplastidibacterium kentomonadis TaxID=1576550 RepID=A0A3Q8F717_9PROT|nr:50S ribosomal protein L30 [Candidatus Kinetoplastibacterium sorsogonicusi]AWD32779.1 50S ribosomal protein L30 [Candidatus Kinetoplastibacterium sorsogonicusi]
MSNDQIKIKLIRSLIGTKKSHRETAISLGLHRLNSISILKNTPETRGMIRKINYLIQIF